MQDSDPELVQRAARGEHAAFTALVQKHLRYLFSLAYSLVGNSADAEDVLQESLTGAYRGLAKYQGRAPVKVWLAGIVARQAARFHQNRKAKATMSIDDLGQDAIPSTPSSASASATDQRIDIEYYLRRLSADHRQVVVLREIHGLSYREISEAIGVPRGTVESRLFRAREELAAMLKGYVGPC